MSKRISISKKVRFDVFKRDSFTCQYCGKSAPDIVLEVDHIIPVSKDGTNDISNLVTSCFDCNRGKGDKKLTENQTLKKQKKELDKLNQKREQLEMIAQWKLELLNIENEEVNKVMEILNKSLLCNFSLTESGIVNMKKLLKKYGFNEVVECAIISFNQYESEEAFNKIEAIIKTRQQEKVQPGIKDLYYIRGIAKKRFHYCNEQTAIILLKQCYELDASIESLKSFTITCKNWSQWTDGLNKFIEENQYCNSKNDLNQRFDYVYNKTNLSLLRFGEKNDKCIYEVMDDIFELYSNVEFTLAANEFSNEDIETVLDYILSR